MKKKRPHDTPADIANRLLSYAKSCERTARNGRSYETKLQAKGRAEAYRTAANVIATKMRQLLLRTQATKAGNRILNAGGER